MSKERAVKASETPGIERLEEIKVYENPWVKVYFDRVRFPNKKEGFYNRVVLCDGRPGVIIVPILPAVARMGPCIVLIHTYRYALGAWSWELPRGDTSLAESLAENARRELLEETGYEAGHLRALLGALYAETGYVGNPHYVFVASDLRHVGDPSEGSEAIDVGAFAIPEVRRMLATGEIKDAVTIAALCKLFMERGSL